MPNADMKFILTILTSLTLTFAEGQTNLVPNHSFELLNTCPVSDNFNNIQNWFNSSSSASPDILDTCSGDASFYYGAPQNFAGYQVALDGSSYAGVVTYYDSLFPYREYIEVKLNSALIVNTKYYVSFYVSLADTSREAADQIGCLFSMDTIRYMSSPLNLTPQISNPNFNYLSDKQNWVKISNSFIADSAYKYLTLGNFKDSINTHVIYAPGGSSANQYKMAYYFIDNVCVSTDSLACNSFVSVEQIKETKSINVFPNPFHNKVTLQFDNAKKEICTLTLYDHSGQIMRTINNITSDQVIIQRNDLENGLYYFVLRTGDRVIVTGKLAVD